MTTHHQGNPPIPPFGRDEDLIRATRAKGTSHWRVYPWPAHTLVLGRGSRAGTEVYLDRCRQAGIPILRRRGGGCAVYLDPGNVIVAAAFPLAGMGRIDHAWQISLAWLLAGLKRIGYPEISIKGVSDLTRGEKKVGGTCLYRQSGLVFFSASLLIKADLARVGQLLKFPPRQPDYRVGRGHLDFLANLALPTVRLADFCRDLKNGLAGRPVEYNDIFPLGKGSTHPIGPLSPRFLKGNHA